MPILGYNIEGDTWDAINQNAYANIATATENGFLKRIWAKIREPLTTFYFRAVIFRISDGKKIAETGIVAGNGINNSRQSLALNNEPIIAGEQYAILIVSSGSTSIYLSQGGSNLAHWGDAPEYMANGFPDPMPIGQTVNRTFSLYAEYETSAPAQNWTLTISAGLGGAVNPSGIITGEQGTATPTITATPNSGYLFNNWLFDGVSYGENPISFQINDAAAHTLIAVFTETTTPMHTLTMEPTANGTTDPPAGAYQYAEGTMVTIRAIPNAGYRFDHWVETARGAQYILYDNPLTGAMPDVDVSFLAVFVPEEPPPATFNLTINSQPITGVPVTVEAI